VGAKRPIKGGARDAQGPNGVQPTLSLARLETEAKIKSAQSVEGYLCYRQSRIVWRMLANASGTLPGRKTKKNATSCSEWQSNGRN